RGGDRPEPGPAGPVDPRHPSFGVPAPRARPRRPAGLTGPTRTTRLIWRPKMATTGAGDDDTTTVDPPEHASTDTAVAEYPQRYPHDWAADVLGSDGRAVRLRPVLPTDADKIALFTRRSPSARGTCGTSVPTTCCRTRN